MDRHDVLARAKAICDHANSSADRKRRMRDCIALHNPEHATIAAGLFCSAPGHWDGTLKLIKRMLDVKEAVIGYCSHQDEEWSSYSLAQQRRMRSCPVLTTEQWDVLRSIHEVLELCASLTRSFSLPGPTMHLVLVNFDHAYSRISTWLDNAFALDDRDGGFFRALLVARDNLRHYINKYILFDAVLVGFVLNPWCGRLAGLKTLLRDPRYRGSFSGDKSAKIESLLKRLLEEQGAKDDSPAEEDVDAPAIPCAGLLGDVTHLVSQPGEPKRSPEFIWLEDCRVEKPLPRDGGDILSYWQAREKKFPALASLSRSVLGASASACSLEQVSNSALEFRADERLVQDTKTLSNLVKLRAWREAGFEF